MVDQPGLLHWSLVKISDDLLHSGFQLQKMRLQLHELDVRGWHHRGVTRLLRLSEGSHLDTRFDLPTLVEVRN